MTDQTQRYIERIIYRCVYIYIRAYSIMYMFPGFSVLRPIIANLVLRLLISLIKMDEFVVPIESQWAE